MYRALTCVVVVTDKVIEIPVTLVEEAIIWNSKGDLEFPSVFTVAISNP